MSLSVAFCSPISSFGTLEVSCCISLFWEVFSFNEAGWSTFRHASLLLSSFLTAVSPVLSWDVDFSSCRGCLLLATSQEASPLLCLFLRMTIGPLGTEFLLSVWTFFRIYNTPYLSASREPLQHYVQELPALQSLLHFGVDGVEDDNLAVYVYDMDLVGVYHQGLHIHNLNAVEVIT